ncbi:MAG: hypothetical protein QW666_01410 [Candidatus Woesearchaeota archaeon]
MKIKVQKTREIEVTCKKEEDLETIAEEMAGAQSTLSKVEAELKTLESYESLQECARKVLQCSEISLGQKYLAELCSTLVGQLYQEKTEKKITPGEIRRTKIMIPRQFGPEPTEGPTEAILREQAADIVEEIKYLVPIEGTGMPLAAEETKQKARTLAGKLQELKGKSAYLTFEAALGKKEAVQAIGREVVEFLKQHLLRLQEVEHLAKSGSLYELHKGKVIEE